MNEALKQSGIEVATKDNLFLEKIRTMGRTVFIACYNVLHEGNEIQYPGNISEKEWNDQWFRVWHPSLQKLEAHQKKIVETTHGKLKSMLGRLKNVSTGDNRGAGMNVVREEVESAFGKSIFLKRELFVQTVLSRMISKMAANDPGRKEIQKKIRSGEYEEALRDRLSQKDERRRDLLQQRVERYQNEAVQRRGRKLQFFEKPQDLIHFTKE